MTNVTYGDVLRTPGTTPLYIAAFLARIPMMALPLVLTLLVVEGLDGTYGQAGLVAAAETIGVAFGGPWRGRAIDRTGLRRALVPSIVVLLVAYPLMIVSPFLWLLPLAFVGGLFMTPIHSIVRTSLAARLPTESHRSAFALDAVCAEASFIVGPAAAGAVVALVSPAVGLLSVAGSVAIGLLILWVLNPPTRGLESPPTPALSGGARWMSTDLVLLYLITGASMIAMMAADLGVIAALRELDALAVIGVVYLGWGVASVVGGLVYGVRPTSIRPSVLLLTMSVLIIPIGLAQSPVALALAVVPAGLLGAPIMAASSEWIARLTDESVRAEAMGWQAASIKIGGALAAPVVGVAIDHAGAAAGFAVGGGAGALIAVVAVAEQRLRRRDRAAL